MQEVGYKVLVPILARNILVSELTRDILYNFFKKSNPYSITQWETDVGSSSAAKLPHHDFELTNLYIQVPPTHKPAGRYDLEPCKNRIDHKVYRALHKCAFSGTAARKEMRRIVDMPLDVLEKWQDDQDADFFDVDDLDDT